MEKFDVQTRNAAFFFTVQSLLMKIHSWLQTRTERCYAPDMTFSCQHKTR